MMIMKRFYAYICLDRETSKKLATDPMYKLEHGETDQINNKSSKPELAKLHNLQTRWKDDFGANQLMRKIFRVSLRANHTI